MTEGIVRTKMGTFVLRGDLLSSWVERENRLDIHDNIVEIACFAHYIPEGGVVIDAGACLGDHTVTYSQIVGSKGRVYAFEPHPLTYEALDLNMARLNNVITVRAGLSDMTGSMQFVRDAANIGASFVSDAGDVTVEVVTLDEYLFDLTHCDFVHLDAEGLETRILRGGRALIEKFHPTLVVEVCDKHLRRAGSSEAELMALLAEFGYRVLPIPSHTEAELRDVLAVWP
jgi:FkbM family methyltransferase